MKIPIFLALAVSLASANQAVLNTSAKTIPASMPVTPVSPNSIAPPNTDARNAIVIETTTSSMSTSQTPSSAPSTNATTLAPVTTPSTTPIPTTTTSAPVTSTVAPTPTSGKWSVMSNGSNCVLVQMAARLDVTIAANNKSINKIVDVPSNAYASGICGTVEQNLTLTWPVNGPMVNNVTINDTLTLHFLLTKTENQYELHCVEVKITDLERNATNTTVFMHDKDEFTTGLENSYRCARKQDLPLKIQGMNKTVGYLRIENLQFQAFMKQNGTDFALAKDCAFDTPDVVPIAVGCALAALVVIVLVAYLVGRKRSQAQGYVSM